MRNRLVFLLAIIFALATATLTYNYLNNAKAALDQTEYLSVIVAAQDIPGETIIQPAMLTTQKKPAQLKHPKEITNAEELVGKILVVPATAGQSILSSQIYLDGDQMKGLAYLIPVGKRAVTIAVNDVSGVAGLLNPGDRVDILATITTEETVVIMPLQDLEILAVGQRMSAQTVEPAGPVNTVTLAVQYNDAKPLMMASQKGVIQLMLRNPTDHVKGFYGPYKMSDLMKGTAAAAAGGSASGKN